MYKSFFKRVIDFALAFFGGVIILPIFLVVSVLVALKLGLPVLFKQERPGKNGQPFMLYKFRSMTNEKDANGVLLPNEQRLTSFGRLLRSTSLDELPSLINVLKGDMSLVGPRPLRMRYLPLFSERQMRRHEVRPGITGYAQVNGRSNATWEEKFDYDIQYVDRVSFLFDIQIIFKTIINVVARKDTAPKDQQFEVPFDEYIQQKGQHDATN